MFHKLIPFVLLATLLAACNGALSVEPITPPAPEPEQPDLEASPATELPSTELTPVMVEPPEQRAPRPINSVYLPQRGDGNMIQDVAYLDSSDLLIMESYPIQVALGLKGSLPTPCNQLRVIARQPDEQNRIQVEVYSVIEPGQACIQVLEPFEANIGLGSFPAGHYSVWANGEPVGEFDS